VAKVPIPAENTVKPCEYCDTLIFFARTPKPANMPLEAKPLRLYRVKPLGPGETQHACEAVEELLFVPHWGKCPGAARAREKARR